MGRQTGVASFADSAGVNSMAGEQAADTAAIASQMSALSGAATTQPFLLQRVNPGGVVARASAEAFVACGPEAVLLHLWAACSPAVRSDRPR